MPTGIRPSKSLNKILYKIMKTPKNLQQDSKEIPPQTIQFWRKENLPTNPGIL